MTTTEGCSVLLRVWCRHRCDLFVEGVAVDTDDREAATEPEASGNKLPAAQSATDGVQEAEPGLSKHEIHTTLFVKATSRARHRPLQPS